MGPVMSCDPRPNILMVVFDSLSQVDFDTAAGELPTLSALRGESTSFSNAYVCSPESGPARASLFTGLDMAAHGVWTDGVALPARETPLPEHFAVNGYRTWLVGRRQLAGVSTWTTEHARPQEYAHIAWAHGPLHRSRQNAYLAWLQGTAPQTYAEIFPSQPNPDDTSIPEWQCEAMIALPDDISFSTWVGASVCDQMKIQSARPFLGIAGFVVGDTMGAGLSLGRCTETLNSRALRQADAALKRTLKFLPEDSVIVVTAGRGSTPDTRPMREVALNVPLMIRTPDRAAKIVSQGVATMDIAPTLYEMASLRPPQRIQGASLLGDHPRGWALSRLRNPDQPHQTALRTDQWKLVMVHSKDMAEPPAYHLYDLNADPKESRDLALDPDNSQNLEDMIDLMIDAHVALEDRTEPRIAKF